MKLCDIEHFLGEDKEAVVHARQALVVREMRGDRLPHDDALERAEC